MINARLASYKAPDVFVEAAELLLNLKKQVRVADGRFDLQLIANNSRIAHQPCSIAIGISRHTLGVEAVEGGAVVFALLQNRVPAPAGLCTLENQELEEFLIMELRHDLHQSL